MERYFEKWKEFQLNESMAGLSKKEREKVKRSRATTKKVKRSLGMSDETVAGQKEMMSLAKGVMEEEELTELNPAHDKHTGRFPKGGGKKGDSYSLSGPAVAKAGLDPKHAKKGIYTGNKDKDGKRKVQLKYTMANDCGRQDQNQKPISPKKYCSKYPELYPEGLEDPVETQRHTESNDDRVSTEYVKATFENALEDAMKRLRAMLIQTQKSNSREGRCSLEQIIRIIDKFELAQRGKAFAPPQAKKT